MSTSAERIKAAVERGEAEAEQEETEGGDFTPPEQPEQPEQPDTDTEEEEAAETEQPPEPEGLSAEQAHELEKATASYLKRVEKVFGAGNVPPACSKCEGLGFDLTGGEAEPVLLAHEQYRRCDECDGYGIVRTGSHVQGHDLHDCPKCVGRGYLERIAAPAAVPEQRDEYGTPAWMGNVQGSTGP